jgi:heptose-I-phosphate ethanolaminephosphotransferase
MTYFIQLGWRLLVAVICLFIFFSMNMMMDYEVKKTFAWSILIMTGIVGLCVSYKKMHWAMLIASLTWIIFFTELAIRGFIRRYLGIKPNASEIFNILANTNHNEAFEFLISQWRLVLFCFFIWVITVSLAIATEIKLKKFNVITASKRTALFTKIIASIFFLLSIAALFNPVMRRDNALFYWPYLYSVYKSNMESLAELKNAVHFSEKELTTTVYQGPSQQTIVFVIGESLTRNNMSLYGYERKTTPSLDTLRDELFVFKDVISGSYMTASSIIRMLSPASILQPDNWKNNPNIIQLAKAAGYKTYWISNQMAYDGWATLLANQTDKAIFTNRGDMISESSYDGAVLPHVHHALQEAAPLKLIVVHLLGSHFYYYLRYPEQFNLYNRANDAVSTSMHTAGRAQWVIDTRNVYDNSVAYNDMVIGNLVSDIKLTTQTPAKFLYVSDHGQEVGHNRDFARHSAIDKTGWEIPMLLWSNRSVHLKKDVIEARPYQTDRLDATLLGLMNIKSPFYHANDDILGNSFISRPRLMEGVTYTTDQ